MADANETYVQFGAGFSSPDGWLSYDTSPTLRVQRLPVVGKILARLSGNAAPFPDRLLIGDIVTGLPLNPGSVSGLYASHVLEHLPLDDMRVALARSFDLLRSGGVFRLIVPDLHERARQYVARVEAGDPGASQAFMDATFLGQRERTRGIGGRIRSQFGNSSHLWMWDYLSMAEELRNVGFTNVRKASLGDSGDPMFDLVEDATRFVDGDIVEVAIHAEKP